MSHASLANLAAPPLNLTLKGMSALAAEFGAPKEVEVEFAVKIANGSADLSIDMKLVKTWLESPDLGPVVPRYAFQSFSLVAGVSKNVLNPLAPPSFSLTSKGDMYLKPTRYDAWLTLTPSVGFDNTGGLSFTGAMNGACGQHVSKKQIKKSNAARSGRFLGLM